MALDVLAERLSGSDLITMLLEVARRRADRLSPADVLRQYRRDRFVAPAQVDPLKLARLQLDALESSRQHFELVALSPVAPFGTHSVLGSVHQNNVVTTMRSSEVAADPTNALALEAALRRQRLLARDPRAPDTVRLAAVDRVVRAQRFDGPDFFSHFSLFGLVIAGRDVGGRRFESEALATQLKVLASFVLGAIPTARVHISLSDFDGRFGNVLDEVSEATSGARVVCQEWPQRTGGRGYYSNVCFKLSVETEAQVLEVGDGGIVDWTQTLLQNRKERLMIGGLSLERLALITTETGTEGGNTG